MTAPFWPTDLPRPDRDGHSRTWGDGRTATQPEYGPPRIRRRYSSAADPISMSIDVDLNGLMRWRRFIDQDLIHGSRAFWMPDWVVDGALATTSAGALIVTAEGAPITVSKWLLCMIDPQTKIVETPKVARFRVAFGLLVMP